MQTVIISDSGITGDLGDRRMWVFTLLLLQPLKYQGVLTINTALLKLG